MKNKVEMIHVISGIILILISIFLVFYYTLIIKNHTGMIDWWAIVILVIPAIVLCVCRIIIEKYPIIEIEKNIFKKIVYTISEILIIPFLLLYLLINLFIPNGIVRKKDFKKLIKKGFKYQYKNRAYYLSRDNIIIQILYNLENYYISFDNGNDFVRIEESKLGSQHDRDELKFRLHEYITAPSLYKQKGDVVPPISYFIDFLHDFIE